MKTAVFVMIAFLVMVSVAFGQAPYGTEPIRNDAPIDSRFPSGVYHEYTAYKGTPVIDGDINDAIWLKIPFTEMELWQEGTGVEDEDIVPDVYSGETTVNWMGPSDKTARFKMLWDDGGVYFVTVEDDDEYVPGPTVLTEPWKIWEGDNVQVGIDTDYGPGKPRADEGAEVNFGESGWSVVNFVDESYFGNWTSEYTDPITGDAVMSSPGWSMVLLPGDCDSPEPLANGSAIHGTYDWDSNRITFELGMELWEGIEPGAKQLMSFMANDADNAGTSGDTQGRQGWVEWGRGIGFTKDSGDYGTVLFSEDAPSGEAVESSTWGKIKSTY
jgi:hypothetical protein